MICQLKTTALNLVTPDVQTTRDPIKGCREEEAEEVICLFYDTLVIVIDLLCQNRYPESPY